MSRQLRLFSIAALLLVASACLADTIVLKSGRRISADRTREVNGKIEYEVGDNTFSISKALVDHIETGGARAGGGASTQRRTHGAPPASSGHEQINGHFALDFVGEMPRDLRAQFVSTLEGQYQELSGIFGSAPRVVNVALFSDIAFFDSTREPEWSAAENQGKMRIPVGGLTEITSELSHVLRHEMAHAFVASIAHNCPTWLDEGIAQQADGQTTRAASSMIVKLYADGQQTPLHNLEGPFSQLSDRDESVAYWESLAAVEYIVSRQGFPGAVKLLRRIGAGDSMESALRNVMVSDYPSFESGLAAYVKKTYGRN